MAYGGGEYVDITLPAAADLSGTQYRFVTVDANGRGTTTATAAESVIGIQQNKPSVQDAPMRIRTSGISKLVMGAAANEGAMVCSNLQGFGTATAASAVGVFVGAIALAAVGGTANIGDVLVTRFML